MVNLAVRKLELTDAVVLAEIDILSAVGVLVENITPQISNALVII